MHLSGLQLSDNIVIKDSVQGQRGCCIHWEGYYVTGRPRVVPSHMGVDLCETKKQCKTCNQKKVESVCKVRLMYRHCRHSETQGRNNYRTVDPYVNSHFLTALCLGELPE